MAIFVYSARSRSGKKVDGTVEANDRRAAMAQVERMGHIPVSVTERSAASAAEGGGVAKPRFQWRTRERMAGRELLTFTTELSDLLASGMTLGNALNSLASRKSGRPSDRIIEKLRDAILQGASLSDALAQQPATFTRLYVSMIHAGEASGAMDEVLRRLVEHYERMQDLKEKVVMALVYPLIVMVMGAATLVFCMISVIPKFKTIFDQMNATLPLPTRMLIGMSDWLAKYGIFAAIAITIGFIMANRAVKTSDRARTAWHGFLLKMPLVRGVVACAIYANFARTLGTLLSNGVPVLQALGIVEKTVGNVVIGKELLNARDRVTDGTTISGPLAAGKVLPRMMIDMLAIGEQTGDMSGALGHIARRYENELNRNVKVFTTALEPIMIVLVAIMVGFVAISILMAVFNLTNGLNV
jgi:type IV pilus assembly protein PilC